MITVDEAKALISQNINILTTITKSIAEASGHTLANDLYAGLDIPAFQQSSMDGYALRYADNSKPLKVSGEMAAGTPVPLALKEAECARIFTGAPLPNDADTVVMQEKVTVVDGTMTVHDQNLHKGSNVRDKGAEIRKGALAMKKRSYLSPAAIGFLAGIGIDEVEVTRLPIVSIIVTGKELCKPGTAIGFGQVYESNSYSLSAALRNQGIQNTKIFDADDDLKILTNVLEAALGESDVVLLTGGVSVGDYDFVIEASKNCGVKQIFHKVKQKPGKPLYFGKHGDKLVFGLPGNPSSVLSCYYNYVLPAIEQLSGKPTLNKQMKATLTQAYTKPAGLTHFLKGKYEGGLVTPLSAQESFRLSSFAEANCLIRLNESQEHFEAGETIVILPLQD